jgi:hypothetical protein
MTVRSNPYIPQFIKSATRDSKPVQLTYEEFNLQDGSERYGESFKYDPLGYPLKSTQQLNLDWSKFENHTFFSSAEVKVNEAFNRIINGYPFDGSKKEVEEFLDSLSGFEKWVFDRFPRWSGALHFSGTQVGEIPSSTRGNWIAVKDKSGATNPELAKNNKGDPVLNPAEEDSFTIETLVFLPKIVNDTQVIFQKSSTPKDGITFYLEPSLSAESVVATFCVSSGSHSNSVSCNISKGSYNHLCLSINKQDTKEHSLQFYVNETLVSESITRVYFSKLDIDEADFLIGSGSSFYDKNTLVTPAQTFSGSLDDLRVFHSLRDSKLQKLYASRGVYSTPDLKLYYRFNEPSGSLSLNGNTSIDSLVLDSSGNSLHSNINNFNFNLRQDASKMDGNIMVNERNEFKIVLFPAYGEILDLNQDLLTSASSYDRANPNNIIKLIPPHYLLEGASQQGFDNVEGNAKDPIGGEGIPGQSTWGSTQIILSFLYIWAKFFDEMKTYLDSFVTLRTVGYDLDDTIPDNFLEDMVRYYGFYLPKFFNHSTVQQFAEGETIDGINDGSMPLKKIQSILLRRVLTNLPDIMRSKGTQHSIRSFLRSVGIDPDNSLRIREYGGPTTKQLTTARENRTESKGMIEFSGGSLVSSLPLSASRIEPGFPEPRGSFFQDPETGENLGTTWQYDGLLTSGSWHTEAVFKIPLQKMDLISDEFGNQSLLRMTVTGSSANSRPGLIANVIATQFVDHPKEPARVHAFIRPGFSNSSPVLKLSVDLGGKGIFDGDKWNVAIGCRRNDEIESNVSSSYYLFVGKNDSGDSATSYVTSSYFLETSGNEGNAFRSGSTQLNVSGAYINLGPGQSIPFNASYCFLNDSLTVAVEDMARTTDYAGWASNLRFWSKGMSEEEWIEHVRNPASVGVDNPYINYNFVSKMSGSFEKLRLDTLQKQPERSTDSLGNITLLDFSVGLGPASGSGFLTGSKIIMGDVFRYTYVSPHFDEAATDDKIRIRSFQEPGNLRENPWAVESPSYLSNDMFLQEEPQDDTRLSIEFSVVDSLDKDIVSMFSSLDPLNDALGSPELMFSPDYPSLEVLRDVYFNRLSGKIDFRRFLEFYRWFDISISSFIEQLIPSKTLYKGTNYVVESHMLERHKNIYRHSGNYLGDRQVIQDSLLLQQIVGKLKKY